MPERSRTRPSTSAPGAPDRGRAELATALTLASELEVVRPLALAAGLTGELIGSTAAAGASGWLRRRLAAARAVFDSHVPPALSDRELVVLALLPSLLNAAEIADELTVSVNTVKTHIRSIYTKLGVGNRRDAVRRARDCNLLP